ncbi:MAG: transglutaminase domain-containing protein [Desulfobacteraceae bacterium]|nr:transglutaminase domain-containing protein [Desulfobacteraceae bacterium]MBC2756885.1 transglutaminase domain-containing protein [Desulfobacteraceae bacterium]
MKKKAIIILSIVCCVIFVTLVMIFISGKSTDDISETSYFMPKQVRYSFSLQNKTNKLLNDIKFWTYAPVKQTSTQFCEKIEASHPYQIINNHLGVQVLEFSFEHFPPFATRIISIKANLLMSENPCHISEVAMDEFLKPGINCESDHPDIIQQALALKAENAIQTAENIFSWVSKHIRYSGYIKNARGSLYALSQKKGDCTEYMYLFIALCRANKIPSRGIAGYICNENDILKPSALHNWAEFFDGKVWWVVDPQNKIFMENRKSYFAMRIIERQNKEPMLEFNRFRVQGQGIHVKMN